MIHSVKKSLTEYGDKVSADEKAAIEAALKEAEEAVREGDKDTIEAKTKALATAATSWPRRCTGRAGQGAAGRSRQAATPVRPTTTWSMPSSKK